MNARLVALATAALLAAGLVTAAPASAGPGNGWGWGQLDLSSIPAGEVPGIRATLLESIPAGVTKARLDAIDPLVKAGALTADQAQLIASVHNASVIATLRKSGAITAATAVAVRRALAGTNGIAAKTAAADIALTRLTQAGVLTPDEEATIRQQLGL